MTLEQAINVLRTINYFLETIFQDVDIDHEPSYISGLIKIIYCLDCMNDFGIYPFDINDSLLNEMYSAKRADLPEYDKWVESMYQFVKDHKIYIGEKKEELNNEI